MSNFRISVITPVYNGEDHIEACLQNVVNQRCPFAEHVLVDGCSTDKTIDIIQAYAKRYPHIHWISEEDKGQYEAMNKGITLAKSEIISFLNADDYYEPGVLNRVLELFKNLCEPTLLVGNCNIIGDRSLFSFPRVNKPSKLGVKDLLIGREVNPFPCNPSAYFYHKSLHEKVGYYTLPIAEDLDFIFRALQATNTVYINETWGNFRLRAGTKTFEDIRSGKALARWNEIYEKYMKCLPLLERWQVYLLRFWYYKICQKKEDVT
jgi:glycosyltransferase involved in cell wall biosynthesis